MRTAQQMMGEWPPERVNPMLEALGARTGTEWSVDFALTGIRYRAFPNEDPFHLCVYPEDGRWFLDKNGATIARGGPWEPNAARLTYDEAVNDLLTIYERRKAKK